MSISYADILNSETKYEDTHLWYDPISAEHYGVVVYEKEDKTKIIVTRTSKEYQETDGYLKEHYLGMFKVRYINKHSYSIRQDLYYNFSESIYKFMISETKFIEYSG